MILPPVDHIVYIPVAIGLGVLIGWQLGARAVQQQWNREERRRRRLEEEA